MTYAKRVDVNQLEITKVLRKMGCQVHVTSSLGAGYPDLNVSLGEGKLFLVEIKDGSKPPSARKLTPAEQKFFDSWGAHCVILTSVDDAIEFVNRERKPCNG